MKSKVVLFFKYFVFWVLLFWVLRFVFLLFNVKEIEEFHVSDIISAFIHGSILDFSMSGYLTALPSLFIIVSFFTSSKWLYYVTKIYFIIFILIISIIGAVDAELYQYWGIRLDTTPLLYLKTPKDAMASVNFSNVVKFTIAVAVIFLIFYTLYNKYLAKAIVIKTKPAFHKILLSVSCIPLLIVPIRGGFDVAPVNIGRVYFHHDQFLNHAAINVIWNIGYALENNTNSDSRPVFMEDERARDIYEDLFQPPSHVHQVLNTKWPNILVIILESFTGKIVEEISGAKGISPNLSSIMHDGIFFENFYATGDRSDKGLVGILSGYPTQPTTSIIKFPDKTQKLPNLAHDLLKAGYSTSFYYGGDINFANMRSYLLQGKYQHMVTKSNFDSKYDQTKWGVHDHVVFIRLLNDMNAKEGPFFKVMFTLSSHEPFDVPYGPKFDTRSEDGKFKNAIAYTDSCLGDFINRAKTEAWWKNSLVVLLADHGTRLPGHTPNYAIEKYQIPMIWTGGALQITDTVIGEYCSQTDVAMMLLNQLGLNTESYKFSKDVFDSNSKSFSYYSFNNGFGFITDSSKVVYDNTSKSIIESEGIVSGTSITSGKALLQTLMIDFFEK